MSLADIGAMEYFASFSNGGFPRGYAKNTSSRNYFKEAYNNMAKQAPYLKNITFACQNYDELKPIKGAVIYLDPPYKGTHHYDYARFEEMDYFKFWDWVRKISKDNFVFISEQQAPDDFQVVWEKQATRTTNKENNFTATEKLFTWMGELNEH